MVPSVEYMITRDAIARHGFDGLVVVATVALYATAWPTLHVTHVTPAAVAPFVAAFAALPFLLIRTNPALGWAISAISALLIAFAFEHQPGNDMPFQVVHAVVLIPLLFAVALRASVQTTLVAWLATSLLFGMEMPGDGALVGWPIGLTALVLFGLLIRWLVLSRRELARQEEVTELERARRAILEEKASIARDLHDVVAHHMSLVVVQAQSAPYRVSNVSPEAQAEFDSIGETARAALNEIRAVLGLLRSDGQLPENAPQPGVSQLPELLVGAERAGLPLTWTVTGDQTGIADTVGLALYRILQESLANAARHASGAPVRVGLDYGVTSIVLTVVNGPAVDRAEGDGRGIDGHGIAGMQDRAAAVGGRVDTGTTADGGFEVTARLSRVVGAVTGPDQGVVADKDDVDDNGLAAETVVDGTTTEIGRPL